MRGDRVVMLSWHSSKADTRSVVLTKSATPSSPSIGCWALSYLPPPSSLSPLDAGCSASSVSWTGHGRCTPAKCDLPHIESVSQLPVEADVSAVPIEGGAVDGGGIAS